MRSSAADYLHTSTPLDGGEVQRATAGNVWACFVDVHEQRLGLFFCIGSIGACVENHVVSLYVQDGGRSFDGFSPRTPRQGRLRARQPL